ncbi:FcoT family thioesterase [Nocardia australiensis]|uniref:FcoT family thioesterase n=1 Tax=Nocardia australiensis TaxID=2887191 RepID=UPI001D15D2D2|nr:FcoT family thioesterase [Nocardia australiensis]
MKTTDRRDSVDSLEVAHDTNLLADVLQPYRPDARYLRQMTHRFDGEKIRGDAELAIEGSCYIDDTGHLNAVDALISYNQMAYLTIATLIRHSIGPVFSEWSMAEFRRRHLPDMVITDSRFTFKRPIDSRRFRAELIFDSIETYRVGSQQRIALTTSVDFGNDTLDGCRGEVRVVIVGEAR